MFRQGEAGDALLRSSESRRSRACVAAEILERPVADEILHAHRRSGRRSMSLGGQRGPNALGERRLSPRPA
jgi:hypothetical protein